MNFCELLSLLNFSMYLQTLHKISEPTREKNLGGTILSSFRVSGFKRFADNITGRDVPLFY